MDLRAVSLRIRPSRALASTREPDSEVEVGRPVVFGLVDEMPPWGCDIRPGDGWAGDSEELGDTDEFASNAPRVDSSAAASRSMNP